jgi:hypothetical protein
MSAAADLPHAPFRYNTRTLQPCSNWKRQEKPAHIAQVAHIKPGAKLLAQALGQLCPHLRTGIQRQSADGMVQVGWRGFRQHEGQYINYLI